VENPCGDSESESLPQASISLKVEAAFVPSPESVVCERAGMSPTVCPNHSARPNPRKLLDLRCPSGIVATSNLPVGLVFTSPNCGYSMQIFSSALVELLKGVECPSVFIDTDHPQA
jgi:hypothetical protein